MLSTSKLGEKSRCGNAAKDNGIDDMDTGDKENDVVICKRNGGQPKVTKGSEARFLKLT
jgi:hypothetical protein